MKAYKIDFDGKKFVALEFDVKHEFDLSNDPDTNIIGFIEGHNCHKEIVEEEVRTYNRRMVDKFDENSKPESIFVYKCKDCGKYHYITKAESDWYLARGFSEPKRCSDCRHKNRMSRVKL